MPRNAPAGGADDPLFPLVQSLQAEVEGLRASGRLRAVIEQAKGVLVERYGITPGEAFNRLREMSQTENARLVDVAATVLGSAHPTENGEVAAVEEAALPRQMRTTSATSQLWRAARAEPTTRAAAVGAVVEALAAATTDGDAAASLIVDLSGSSQPDGVMIYTALDGALELLGASRYPQEVSEAWSRVPLSLDLPLTRCWHHREPELVTSADDLLQRYPSLTKEALYGYQSWVFAPVLEESRALGVVALGWTSPRAIDEDESRRLLALVRRAGPVLLRSLTGREPAKQQLAGLLRLSYEPWMVLVPSGQDARSPETLLIESVAPDVPDATTWAGRRLLAALPGLATHRTLLTDLTRLLQDDTLYVVAIDVPGTSGAPWDSHAGQLRAIRTGRRIVLTWRDSQA